MTNDGAAAMHKLMCCFEPLKTNVLLSAINYVEKRMAGKHSNNNHKKRAEIV